MAITEQEMRTLLDKEIANRKAAEVAAINHKIRADRLASEMGRAMKELASASDGDEMQAVAKRFLYTLPGFERRVSVQGAPTRRGVSA